MCCYTAENFSVVEQLSPDPHTEMGYAELFLDVRLKLTHDYFKDPSPTLSHSALESLPLRACFRDRNVASEVSHVFRDHIQNVADVFSRQNRMFVYSVSVRGTSARIFRWDRSGCVVTSSFDIHEEPDLLQLVEILTRFAQYPRTRHDCGGCIT